MAAARLALVAGVLFASLVQLWRVPRVWTALILFLILFPKMPLALVPGDTTALRIDDVVVGVFLGVWVLTQLLGRARPVPPSPATPFILLYGLIAIVTSLLGIAAGTATPMRVAFHFGRRVEYALIYYYFFRTIGTGDLPDFVKVFTFAFVATLAVWLIEHGIAVPRLPGTPVDPADYAPAFSASYDFGGYVMVATLVLYGLWSTGTNRGFTTTAALIAGVFLLFNADSRASFFGFAVAILLDLFIRLRWQVALGLASIAGLAPYLVSTGKMERMLNTIAALAGSFNIDTVQQTMFSDPSIAMRLRNWNLAIERWSARPMTGEGLGSYLQYSEQYNQAGSPDGWYVRLLAESGLLGLLSFVLLTGGLLWMLLQTYAQDTRPLPRAIVYASALTVVAMLVNALLIDSFVSYKIMGAFWMVVGVGTRVVADRQPIAVTETGGGRSRMTDVPGLNPA